MFRKVVRNIHYDHSADEVLKSYKDEFDEYLNEEFKKTCEKLSENYGSNYAEMSLGSFFEDCNLR
jgi:hypothetical protein